VKNGWPGKRTATVVTSAVGVISDKGESTSDKGSNPDKGEDQHEERPTWMEINMVFTIPAEFRAPTETWWS
jgi:hypothetical protein